MYEEFYASYQLYQRSSYLLRWGTGTKKLRVSSYLLVLHPSWFFLGTILEMMFHSWEDASGSLEVHCECQAQGRGKFTRVMPIFPEQWLHGRESPSPIIGREAPSSPANAASCQPCYPLVCGPLLITGHSSSFPTVGCAWGWPPSYSDPSYAWEKSAQLGYIQPPEDHATALDSGSAKHRTSCCEL